VYLILYLISVAAMAGAGFMFVLGSHDWFARKLRENTTEYVAWMVTMFDRMFLTVTARQCVIMIASSTFLSGALMFWLTGSLNGAIWKWMIRFVIIGAFMYGPWVLPVGWTLPRKILNFMWRRRVRQFDEQMLDGLTFLSNSLKSGLSLLQAIDMIVQELPNPLSQEWALVMSQQKLGVRIDEALSNLEKRIGSEDVQIIVTSITILRESGGNLAEVFDTIAYTVRERRKVEGKIEAMTAQGVMQGIIIVAMPVVLGGILWMIDPFLISRLWTTVIGWVMLIFMFMLQFAGGWMIKKIVTIEV
jgi:tight adherence protein B